MILEFNKEAHHGALMDWLGKRNLPSSYGDNLPSIGFVGYTLETVPPKPVASAHLRMCEQGVALLDNLITDPDASSKQRHEAIDGVVKRIIKTAKEKDVKYIMAYSVDVGTLKRSEAHGFVRLPHVLIGLDLGAL
jgi:hypothetical protein